MSVNKGINETQRVPQAVAAGSSTEIIDSIRNTHKETVELLSHVNHTLSMYKLQITDLKSQLDDMKSDTINQAIMQGLQHIKESNTSMKSDIENIKESNTSMKSDIENIKNTISELAEALKNDKKNIVEQFNQPANQSDTPPTNQPANQPNQSTDQSNQPANQPNQSTDQSNQPANQPNHPNQSTDQSNQPANQSATQLNDEPAAVVNVDNTDQQTTDNYLLTQLTSEPQKVTVAVPKAARGRRPRK